MAAEDYWTPEDPDEDDLDKFIAEQSLDSEWKKAYEKAQQSYKDQKAIDSIANIAVAWYANGLPKEFLVDRDDAKLIVETLRKAKLLK